MLELSDQEARRLLADLDHDDQASLVAELPADAVKRLMRLFPPEDRAEALSVLYVTDESGKLIDALSLQRFVISEPDSLVSDIMDYTFVCVSAADDQEEAVRIMQRYDQVTVSCSSTCSPPGFSQHTSMFSLNTLR